jgi:cyclase
VWVVVSKNYRRIREIISAGAEKVIIGSYAVVNPDFIRQASEEFGSSTITVCIDVKKKSIWQTAGLEC